MFRGSIHSRIVDAVLTESTEKRKNMSRQTASRKAWETRVRFNRDTARFFEALGRAEWEFSAEVTKAMVIERTARNGQREAITFGQAYGELSMWAEKSIQICRRRA